MRRLIKSSNRRQETPEDRAFRHERGHLMINVSFYFLQGLVVALLIAVLSHAGLAAIIQILGYSLIALFIILFIFNAVLKHYQKRDGGD